MVGKAKVTQTFKWRKHVNKEGFHVGKQKSQKCIIVAKYTVKEYIPKILSNSLLEYPDLNSCRVLFCDILTEIEIQPLPQSIFFL